MIKSRANLNKHFNKGRKIKTTYAGQQSWFQYTGLCLRVVHINNISVPIYNRDLAVLDLQLNDAGVGLLLRRQIPFIALDGAVANGKDENDDDTGGDAEDAARRHDDREDNQHVEGPCHVLWQLRDGLEN